MNPNFTTYITRFDGILNQTLKEIDIADPMMREAIEYSLFPGGKRFRPLLIYLCAEIFAPLTPCFDYLACAIELIHCYSLVHDDLPAMDNDDWRRGKLSCHKQFGEAAAILVGDGMQPLAVEILVRQLPQFLPPKTILDLVQVLVSASGFSGMVSGQSLDLRELKQANLTFEQLSHIHLLKTGKLINACIEMVLIVTNPSHEKIEHLRKFGQSLGLLFQIQDDYLDKYHSYQLGKERPSDEANQKTTFASLYNQSELEALVNKYYTTLIEHLSIFGEKALPLKQLTENLLFRHQARKEDLE